MSDVPRSLAAILTISVAAAGCTAGPPATASPTVPPGSVAPSPTASLDPSIVVVSSRDNIFGAGHASAPAPAGGGAGFTPTAWALPPGSGRIVTFEGVTGQVTGIVGVLPMNGPDGDHNAPATATMTGGRGTDIESVAGISGLIDRHNEMFLCGVFLGDTEPTDPAPERLDFTDRENFELLGPAIAQTFYIGDGGARRFRVPDAATRLFLGFVDGFFWQGPVGYYGNNAGELRARVKVSTQ